MTTSSRHLQAVVQREQWITCIYSNGHRDPTLSRATADEWARRDGQTIDWTMPMPTLDGRHLGENWDDWVIAHALMREAKEKPKQTKEKPPEPPKPNGKAPEIKIDKSFVYEMEDASIRSSLIPEIIAIANAVSADLVAEGIENPGQAERLRAMGVQYGQGYHFGRPMRGVDR